MSRRFLYKDGLGVYLRRYASVYFLLRIGAAGRWSFYLPPMSF